MLAFALFFTDIFCETRIVRQKVQVKMLFLMFCSLVKEYIGKAKPLPLSVGVNVCIGAHDWSGTGNIGLPKTNGYSSLR